MGKSEPAGTYRVVMGPQTSEKRELSRRLRRTMTPSERQLWQRLRANRLGGFQFRRQQVIDGFVADFYCHAAALVVEVDGGVHCGRTEYDAERTVILARRGIAVLRFTNDRIATDVERVLDELLAALHARTPPRPSPERGGSQAGG